jgi:hypothetical protein
MKPSHEICNIYYMLAVYIIILDETKSIEVTEEFFKWWIKETSVR